MTPAVDYKKALEEFPEFPTGQIKGSMSCLSYLEKHGTAIKQALQPCAEAMTEELSRELLLQKSWITDAKLHDAKKGGIGGWLLAIEKSNFAMSEIIAKSGHLKVKA